MSEEVGAVLEGFQEDAAVTTRQSLLAAGILALLAGNLLSTCIAWYRFEAVERQLRAVKIELQHQAREDTALTAELARLLRARPASPLQGKIP